jgi:hypothetical protein
MISRNSVAKESELCFPCTKLAQTGRTMSACFFDLPFAQVEKESDGKRENEPAIQKPKPTVAW